MQSYWIALSSGNHKSPPTPQEMFPLPYDEPEEEREQDWDIQEWYNNVTQGNAG